MASYNKFNQFTDDVLVGAHQFGTHTYKVALSNTAPSASNAVFADITEISAGNGYSAGGTASTQTLTTSSGTAKDTAADVTFTASGGTIGPFRYAIVYNASQTTPLKPLVMWADYGSSITLNSGDTFTVDFDGTNGLFTMA